MGEILRDRKYDIERRLRFLMCVLYNIRFSWYLFLCVCMCVCVCIYRVSQEECARLREGVPYVKVYRYNPKHLCPKLDGYGDNGQRSLKL